MIKYKKIEEGGNYFNKHKSRNPLIRYVMKRFHITLFNIIKKLKIKNLIDIGCGEGYTTNLIHQRFPAIRITAMEQSESAIKRSDKSLRIKKGEIYDTKYRPKSFDAVLATEVLEHLEFPEKAINECKRITKKYCIFSVPNEPLWRITNLVRLKYLSNLGNSPGHIQNWTKNGFKNILKKQFRHVIIKNAILWNFALCWD